MSFNLLLDRITNLTEPQNFALASLNFFNDFLPILDPTVVRPKGNEVAANLLGVFPCLINDFLRY